MKRYIHSSSDTQPWYVVDVPIPKDEKSIKQDERRRIQREIEDENDAYDLEHGEGIYANELPGGYLSTTKFTTPSIKTNDQRNALEAFEIAISEKFDQFDKMCDITFNLTSDTAWNGKIDEFDEGYYIQLVGTRSMFNAFVHGDKVIRKPRHLSQKIGTYTINGTRGRIDWMSKRK